MRLSPVATALAVVVLGLSAAPRVAAEATQVLEGSLEAGHAVGVENLVGAMTVVAGSGNVVSVRATVHAESADLAAQVRIEQVRGSHGIPTLRVRYPRDVDELRYPEGRSDHSDNSYDGHRYDVSRHRGTLLYVDLEVSLPKEADARLQNQVGQLTATGISGTLSFDTASGDIHLKDVSGDLRADTGSGDVLVENAKGRVNCDTGSGNCRIEGMSGDVVSCDTGSGDVEVTDASVTRVDADTGSGDIRLSRVDAEEFRADTGSGDVRLESRGARLASIKADTGSGDVTLGLPPDAGFEAHFDMASGDARARFEDAEPIVRRREVVGYRRGDRRIKIEIDTGSGDVLLFPSGS